MKEITRMYSKLMNKYFRGDQEPVTEGKGVGLVKFANGLSGWVFFAGIFTSSITWHAVFAYWIVTSTVGGIMKNISESTVLQALSNPKMRDYIENCASKIYKEVHKSDPEVNEFTSNVKYTFSDQKYAATKMSTYNRLTNMIFLSKELQSAGYKHTIVLFADTTHIEDMYVVFSKPKTHQYLAYPIPAPKMQELKAMYRKEG
jgi:hypothetical protein